MGVQCSLELLLIHAIHFNVMKFVFLLLPFNGNNESEMMLAIASSSVDFPTSSNIRTKIFLKAVIFFYYNPVGNGSIPKTLTYCV